MPPEWNFLIKLLPKATVDPDWTLTDMTKGLRRFELGQVTLICSPRLSPKSGSPVHFRLFDYYSLSSHIELGMQSDLETPVARRLKTVKHIIIVLSGKGGVSAYSLMGCRHT